MCVIEGICSRDKNQIQQDVLKVLEPRISRHLIICINASCARRSQLMLMLSMPVRRFKCKVGQLLYIAESFECKQPSAPFVSSLSVRTLFDHNNSAALPFSSQVHFQITFGSLSKYFFQKVRMSVCWIRVCTPTSSLAAAARKAAWTCNCIFVP